MKSTLRPALGAVLAAHLLASCGGGSDSSDPEPVQTPDPVQTPATSGFTKSATWTFVLPAAGQSLCYDFDINASSADCSGTAWDVKVTSGGRSATLFTNSGSSGSGRGGAFGGPFEHTWDELAAWTSATKDPTSGATLPAAVFLADSASGVFTGTNGIASAAFEYALGGDNDHALYPSFRTFLITTDAASANAVGTGTAPVYALQVIGYYGGDTGTASGHPKIRWVNRAEPGTVREQAYNATAGWVYVDLATGATTSESGSWQIAFNRYSIKLNGGTSGSGTVAGFLGRTPAGLYDGDGKAIPAALMAATPAATLADLTATDLAVPATASAWVEDTLSSPLAPAYRGDIRTEPLDYGWYSYYPTAALAQAAGLPAVAHLLKANPARATLIRGGENTSYARFRLNSITYADSNPTTMATSAQTWSFGFDIQPAPASAP